MRSSTGAGGAAQRVHALRARRLRTLAVNHQGQFPAVTLSFNLAPGWRSATPSGADRSGRARDGTAGDSPAAASREPRRLSRPRLPTSRPDPGRLVTVYIVLGMLYESFVHPLTILSTLPSAGVGALLALLLCSRRS